MNIKSPWVSPVEQLPINGKSIIAFTEDGGSIYSGAIELFNGEHQPEIINDGCTPSSQYLSEFTHWMYWPDTNNQPAHNQLEIEYKDKVKAMETYINRLEHLVAKSIANIITNDKTPHYSYNKMECDKNAEGELPKTGRWAMPKEIAVDLRNDMRTLRDELLK
jgi:hypothetical protein